AQEQSNDRVRADNGTVTLRSDVATPGGSLPDTETLSSGLFTFSVTLTKSGAQTLTLTDGTHTGSAGVTVSPHNVTHFLVGPATRSEERRVGNEGTVTSQEELDKQSE